jgi:RNA polymerase sigma-70 factor, ECF subfamily
LNAVSYSTAQILSPASLTETRKALAVSENDTASAEIAALTRRLAAHDEAAFREFHTRYFDRLYQFMLVITRGQEHEAREVLQETLLRVARRARPFDDEDAFWCWLKTVARNAARDGGRKQRRYFALLEKFSFRRQETGSYASNGADSRLQTLLAESLNELAPDERLLVEAKYLDGESVRELAASTGLTEKAIESRLLRLRRQLRERLLKKLNEP